MQGKPKEYTDEELTQASELIPSLWVQQHKILNESGLPIHFENRKFLIDIYDDLSPKQALLKPPQIGATIMNSLKSFWVAHKMRKDIIYTLPTQTDVQDIVGGSVNRIIAQNSILMEWVKDHDTVEQKSVGDNLIRYRGTFSPKQATMVPASLLIHDEVDNSDAKVLTLYQTRLEAQDGEENKWRWYFSHPSLAGFGVDIYWQQSDQKEWYIRCNECQKEQNLTWPENISIERESYICKHCQATLPEKSRLNGKWKNKDGVSWKGTLDNYEFSGWHVSQLMLWNKSAKDIIKAYNDPQKDKQYFYNYVLGLPFVGSENKVEPSVVLKNVVPQTNDQEGQIVIGVDTGLPIHVLIGNKQGLFFYTKLGQNPYAQLESYLQRWPKSIIVSDQGGDLIGIRELQQKYPGRVYLCYYRRDRKTNELAKWELGSVIVDRNRAMQIGIDQMKDIGRIRLNGSVEDWTEFSSHFGNIYRVAKETPFGVEYTWERNGPDHFVHTFVYFLTGLDRFAENAAQIVGSSGFEDIPVTRLFAE